METFNKININIEKLKEYAKQYKQDMEIMNNNMINLLDSIIEYAEAVDNLKDKNTSIKYLYSKGLSLYKISKELGIAYSSVYNRAKNIGLIGREENTDDKKENT